MLGGSAFHHKRWMKPTIRGLIVDEGTLWAKKINMESHIEGCIHKGELNLFGQEYLLGAGLVLRGCGRMSSNSQRV